MPTAESASEAASVVKSAKDIHVVPQSLEQEEKAVSESEATAQDSPAYYPSGLLTVSPQALGEARVGDGSFATEEKAGKAILELWIDREGKVVLANTVTSDMSGRATEAILEAFRNLRFKPGEIEGTPVGVILKIEASYDDKPEPAESAH